MEAAITNPLDKELVDRLLQRDGDAWTGFVDQFLGLIKRRIQSTASECRFVLEPAEVDDVIAEVFQSLVKNQMASLRNFRFVCSLRSWLSVIARRVCLAFLSKRPRDRGIGTQTAEDDFSQQILDNPAQDHDPLEQMSSEEELVQIKNGMASLRPNDRRLLELHFTDELNYKQIAEAMGISINSVGPKLQRAQQRLKKLVGCQVESY